jgi:hypothetical protein
VPGLLAEKGKQQQQQVNKVNNNNRCSPPMESNARSR